MDAPNLPPDAVAAESPAPAPSAARGRLLFLFELVWVRLRFILILVATGLVIGQWETIVNHYDKYTRAGRPKSALTASTVEYFCPMHPSVVRDTEGSCPICGMPLSRRAKGAAGELPPDVIGRVQLSPERILLAGVRTAAVGLFPLEREIVVPGFVNFDERKLSRVAARAAGRVERLYVGYAGVEVAAGDPLADFFSPDIIAAIEEHRAVSRGGLSAIAGASRRKLDYLGLSAADVTAFEGAGTAESLVTLRSPRAGVVAAKYIREGQYVNLGTVLYDIANLSVVWIEAEIYEADLPYVKVGQPVEARAEAFPGSAWPGTVAFVGVTVDRDSRTVRVRFDVVNTDGRLKPGLFAACTLRVPVARTEPFASAPRVPTRTKTVYLCPMHPEVVRDAPGKCEKCGGMELIPTEVAADPPAASFTCVMHPEIRSDQPGKCPKCGMELVPAPSGAERVIYLCPMHPEVVADGPGKCRKCIAYMDMDLEPRRLAAAGSVEVLVVPERAVIDTGSRKVVYLAREGGIFDAVECVLGPRTGAFYPVVSGLSAGDVVAAEGAFLVDAESRLHPPPRKDAPPAAPAPPSAPRPGHGGR